MIFIISLKDDVETRSLSVISSAAGTPPWPSPFDCELSLSTPARIVEVDDDAESPRAESLDAEPQTEAVQAGPSNRTEFSLTPIVAEPDHHSGDTAHADCMRMLRQADEDRRPFQQQTEEDRRYMP